MQVALAANGFMDDFLPRSSPYVYLFTFKLPPFDTATVLYMFFMLS